jgi:hypothetical protein
MFGNKGTPVTLLILLLLSTESINNNTILTYLSYLLAGDQKKSIFGLSKKR